MECRAKYTICNIPVIYEDNYLLVLDKPSGLLTIPTPKKESHTLTSILNAQAQKNGSSYRLHPCHRLDRETSGLIIYALGKSVQRKMADEFRKRKIKKTYLAFIERVPSKSEAQIIIPIEGMSAITKYKIIEKTFYSK